MKKTNEDIKDLNPLIVIKRSWFSYQFQVIFNVFAIEYRVLDISQSFHFLITRKVIKDKQFTVIEAKL